MFRNSSATAPMDMSPGWSPSACPGGLSGLIFTYDGSCGSDHTTFLRLPTTQRLILTMQFYYPPSQPLPAHPAPTHNIITNRPEPACFLRLRRLDVVPGHGQVADQGGHDERGDHGHGGVAVIDAAQRVRLAEVVRERGTQRPGHHVGEPERDDRVEPEA